MDAPSAPPLMLVEEAENTNMQAFQQQRPQSPLSPSSTYDYNPIDFDTSRSQQPTLTEHQQYYIQQLQQQRPPSGYVGQQQQQQQAQRLSSPHLSMLSPPQHQPMMPYPNLKK